MTNEQIIRNQWTTEELAKVLVKCVIYEDFDYDWDENLISNGINDYYETSDGERFDFYEEAVEHEVWWLNQEVSAI